MTDSIEKKLGDCGCCGDTLPQVKHYNRPGQPTLVYRLGVHATFLRRMLAGLPFQEIAEDNRARPLAKLTTREKDDPSIAFLDAWATVADVLTFYQERIINEGYLRTATERRSVLELARAIGYELNPGVAASTYLAFTVEDAVGAPGVAIVPKGARVQSIPPQDKMPQTFETIEEITAKAEWNSLKPRMTRPQELAIIRPKKKYIPYNFVEPLINKVADPIDLGIERIPFDDGIDENGKKVTLNTHYAVVEFNGKKYVALNGNEKRLCKLVIEDQDEEKTLNFGETWYIGGGWKLTAYKEDSISIGNVPSAQPIQVKLELSKDDRIIPLPIRFTFPPIPSSKERLITYCPDSFGGETKVQLFATYVFRITSSSVHLKYTWAISTDIFEFDDLYLVGINTSFPEDTTNIINIPTDWIYSLENTINPNLKEVPVLKVQQIYLKGTNNNLKVGDLLLLVGKRANNELETVSLRIKRVKVEIELNRMRVDFVLDNPELQSTLPTFMPPKLKYAAVNSDKVDFDENAVDKFILEQTWNESDLNAFLTMNDWNAKDLLTCIAKVQSLNVPPEDQGIFTFRQRVGFFGHNALRWETLPKVDNTRGYNATDPSKNLDPYKRSWDDCRFRNIWTDSQGNNYRKILEAGVDVYLERSLNDVIKGSWVVFETTSEDGRQIMKAYLVSAVKETYLVDYGISGKATGLALTNKDGTLLDEHEYVALNGDAKWISKLIFEQDSKDTKRLREGEIWDLGDGYTLTVSVIDVVFGSNSAILELRFKDELIKLDNWNYSRKLCNKGVAQFYKNIETETNVPIFVTLIDKINILPNERSVQLKYTWLISSSYTELMSDKMLELVQYRINEKKWTVKKALDENGNQVEDGTHYAKIGCKIFNVRNTTAHLQSEHLELADMPIEDPIEEIEQTDQIEKGASNLMLNQLVLDLKVGQPIVLKGEQVDAPGVIRNEVIFLNDIKHIGGYTTLSFNTMTDGKESNRLQYRYIRKTVTLNANVAPATHGETVREVLGSGDGSQPNQRFVLKKPPLTYVPASTPSGSESTLEVRVNDVLWKEVPSLYGIDERSQNYVVRIDNDARAMVLFGDGKSGARLLSGTENVVAVYRSGIGLDGEVDAGSLTLLQTRPLGIREVTNSLPATGADDPEKLDMARTNAPRTVLTFDRIVSLQDFEDFSRSFAGIGKARAVALWDGGRRIVHITVAGASGKAIDNNLRDNLVAAIKASCDPFQPVKVADFIRTTFSVEARILVDERYIYEEVKKKVERALSETFTFEKRDFGQPVTSAEILAIIQAVEGVIAVDLEKLMKNCVDFGLMLVHEDFQRTPLMESVYSFIEGPKIDMKQPTTNSSSFTAPIEKTIKTPGMLSMKVDEAMLELLLLPAILTANTARRENGQIKLAELLLINPRGITLNRMEDRT